ncbi:MAG: NADP-dependent malic enzyme [bacterium]|jgi:malate dehydrogenase (oxaloacetate-decarboxylating)|nr:NADP-dependent malic enzyme [bacterium]
MSEINFKLSHLEQYFPANFTEEQVAKGKTEFLKHMAFYMHKFYGGKIMTVPKCGVYSFNWFNVWYTPGVSKISTMIRDNNDCSFELSNRGNSVAIVSDSTRVLGDGNCTPSGGLGVMEGKAMLMKYLGGIDASAICIDSRNQKGEHDPDKIIEFVKMLQPSFGAVNLEDISQPNCFKVLDVLREECQIPVWHDDAQGTGCVTLAGLINALKVVNKKIDDVKLVFWGAGASNTTIARLIMLDGADPSRIIMFDTKGALHKNREDIKKDPRFYRKWEICEQTNPDCVDDIIEACTGADALIALSTPGPDVIKPSWIHPMAKKAIVMACANPIPEIYPYAAKQAGAYVVATGRGDFPNQVNNSVGFPGILKGALIVRAKKVTDEMAIEAAHSLAEFAEKRGIDPDNIMPTMDEHEVFPYEAKAVGLKAIEQGVARKKLTGDEIYNKAKEDILQAREILKTLMDEEFIKEPPAEFVQKALDKAIEAVAL